MKPKTIAILTLTVTAIGVGWGILHTQSVKAGATNTAKDNIASPVAQTNGSGTTNQTINNSLFSVTVIAPDKAKQIEAVAKTQYPTPIPDRPKVVVASPSVTFVNYTNDIQAGLVKAGFNIPFINIGGVDAKGLTTKWTITDNGNHITGLDDWLIKFLHQENMVIQNLPSNTANGIFYNPDIGASGTGTLEVTIDYEYANATTGEKYNEQYKGIVDYRTQKNNQPVKRLLTPQP